MKTLLGASVVVLLSWCSTFAMCTVFGWQGGVMGVVTSLCVGTGVYEAIK